MPLRPFTAPRRAAGLLVWAALLLGAGTAAAPDPGTTCHIVGESRTRVTRLLVQGQETPTACYADFLRTALPAFVGVRFGGGGAGAPWNKTLVNTQEMDCVTFVEQVLAMAMAHRQAAETRTAESPDELFALFVHHLNHVRYYDGVVDGRQKRIILFTDAMRMLTQRGVLEDVGAYTGVPFTKRIHYMSSNPSRFAGITNWAEVRQTETQLSAHRRFYYPLDSLHRYEPLAADGDIVGLTTNVDGLDVSHVGFLTVRNGRVKFTHASFTKRQVVLEQDLREYLSTRTSITGIVVFRPVWG